MHQDRLVQPQALTQFAGILGRRIRPEHQRRRIAGREAHQHEGDRQHEEHHDDEAEEAFQQVDFHSWTAGGSGWGGETGGTAGLALWFLDQFFVAFQK